MMQSRQRCQDGFLSLLCIGIFAAACWGAVDCGRRLAGAELPPELAAHLRHLIYFHFVLAQLAVAGFCAVQYRRHRRWRRYYLLVSYSERGMQLNPPGIRVPAARVYRCTLGKIAESPLPPAGAPVLVYPMLMLSGYSSGEKLEAELNAAFAARGYRPELYFQPVLGASPWLVKAAAKKVRPLLEPGTGVLVVAHGSRMPEPPPEPALFCRRLSALLPGVEVVFGYFNQQPLAVDCLAAMRSRRVLLLPFLVAEGVHTRRDLPTPEQASACGKELVRLPVVADYVSGDGEE